MATPAKSPFRVILRFGIVLAIACMLILVAVWRGGRGGLDLVVPDQADARILHARAVLLPPSAVARWSAPQTGRWSAPMGAGGGAFTYNAQKFLEDNPARGGLHLGDDLNGIGWENTDLGDPVFAAADGLVVYAGFPAKGWGGVVSLLHRDSGGWKQSFYGHLDESRLAWVAGQRVARGQLIGWLGEAEGSTFAHLHLEIRRGVFVMPGPGYAPAASAPRDRLDPSALLPGLDNSANGLPGLPVVPAPASLHLAPLQPD